METINEEIITFDITLLSDFAEKIYNIIGDCTAIFINGSDLINTFCFNEGFL